MRMSRRLGSDGRRTIPAKNVSVNSYYRDPPKAAEMGSGTVGFYWASSSSNYRQYCRVDFHLSHRVKHLDGTFLWTVKNNNVNNGWMALFPGSFSDEKCPWWTEAAEDLLYQEYVGSDFSKLKAELRLDMELPAGDYCIYFWCTDTSGRSSKGLTAESCTIIGYVGDRPEE